jgi:hypothetical protein
VATGNNPQFSNELARRLVRIRLDAHVDQPWLREGFRHADLLGWVRQNRARLVAACLTLGRAWIAAGRPRHRQTLGSFEAWAQTVGGILEVAGINGFLANLEEMYETADTEGATWRMFVTLWWERHGTAEVGTVDLHQVALECEPPLPLGDRGDRSQRTRLGKALGRMRDRIFTIGDLNVRIEAVGVRHKAQRWRLALENEGRDERSQRSHLENRGADERSPRSHEDRSGWERLDAEAQRSHQRSPEKHEPHQSVGERGERWERFSDPHTRAGTRADARGGIPEKRSPCSQRSPSLEKSTTSGWERAGERCDERSLSPSAPGSGDGPADFDAVFDAYGLNPMDDDDRLEATRIWMGLATGPPSKDEPRSE